jgi:crotonobetainyl-CoA:carnitine CoA-transferase CaiB-like acyl-CoA transferase
MAITILGALYKRRETGEGHRLQVAMQDAMLHYMRVNFATQGRTGKAALRGGSKIPGVTNAPMGLYPCAPGGPNDYVYIMTSRANPEHWDRLLGVIGREDLIGDTRYLTPADRVALQEDVDEVIAAWTRGQSKFDAMQKVGEAGIPAGAVLDTDELNNDVTFEQRGVMQTMVHPEHRPFKMPGWPVRVDGKATRLKASPMLGEHTDQVISDWLGLNGAAIAALKTEGAAG